MTIHIGSKPMLLVGIALVLEFLGIVSGVIPSSQVFLLGLIVICSLMMFLMMRGMNGGPDGRS